MILKKDFGTAFCGAGILFLLDSWITVHNIKKHGPAGK